MSSVYPGSLDSLATDKTNATEQADDHPGHHNDLADAVNKIEAELGTAPSGSFTTVRERLEDIEADITGGGVPSTRVLTAGSGLTGGGDLSADRTFDLSVDNATVEVASDTLRVKDGGITQAKLSFDPATQTELDNHVNDTTDAHDASAISADSTTLVGTGTDVQAVLEELDNGIADHLADTSNAHAASAVGFNPAGGISSTNVQDAIEEVYSENAGGIPQGGPLTTDLDADGQNINDLADPASPQDAATKAYVDAAVVGATADGWIDDTGETWTYASGSGGGVATFTVAGDQTAKYTTGTRIKLTQTTVKYFVCAGSSHAAGTTTVTIHAGSDYTLANAAISANYHSYALNPQGWPGWFAFTCGAVGFSSKTVDAGRFAVNGRVCYVEFDISGTSNATTFAWVLPFSSRSSSRQYFGSGTSVNSGTTGTSPARVNVPTGGTTTATMGRQWSGDGGYTNSGTKGSQGMITYEI